VIIRKSSLQRRAERGPGSGGRADVKALSASSSLLDAAVRLVLKGTTARGASRPGAELEKLPLPDLLSPLAAPGPDPESLINLLDLAFLGRASAGEMDKELDAMPAGSTHWVPTHFADDLFLTELVHGCLGIEIRGQRLASHRRFLKRVLTHPPEDLATIRHRQAIVRELEDCPALREASEELVARIYYLLSLLRASRDDARLEPVRFRLDVLRAFRAVVEQMTDGFADATSGLSRLRQDGHELRHSRAFGRMEALLDHQSSMATLRLEAVVGADGRLRHLEIRGIKERKGNVFYRRPLRRWWDRLRIFFRRYSLDPEELVDRLVMGVYQEIVPALARVVQTVCHLEVYMATMSFADGARARGLEVCLPEMAPGARLRIERLFNPLLLTMMEHPVPTDLDIDTQRAITLVTGPNSGGKTRLLQAVGIAQVLAQSGLQTPCSRARMPVVAGLFASIVELDRADQFEGRLGKELVRLRTLLETVPSGSLVLLDELCSGTNPTEAIEIVDMVLRLLHRLDPVAFVTTHFLGFARDLHARPSTDGLGFLQVEVDAELGATFRFIPGVATTSLAVGTARRLGVTFEEIERRLEQRITGAGGTNDTPEGLP